MCAQIQKMFSLVLASLRVGQVGVVGALSAFEPYAADNADPASRLRACMRLISRMPTLAALAYRTSMGYPLIYPRVPHHPPIT